MKKRTKRGTSVALTTKEKEALKQYRKGFVTEVECALSIGIDRNVLNRISTFGSGSPDKIEKIKMAISGLLEEDKQTEPATKSQKNINPARLSTLSHNH